MKFVLGALLTMFFMGCSNSSLSIDVIESQISQKGSRGYLDELSDDPKLLMENLQTLQEELNKGSPEAFKIVDQLQSVSDAGMSTSLDFMVARSIPYQPEMAMATVSRGFRLTSICTVPFIEVSQETVDEYLSSTFAALESEAAKGSELAAKCKSILEERLLNRER